jgi:Predicted secreted hydrolase
LTHQRTIRLIVTALISVSWGADFPYRAALPGYRYSFPRDHFAHGDFRTEWWYYTGNLRSSEGKRFGFELVFFRQGARRDAAENRSAWRIDDAYLAHLALTDIDGKRFYPHERLNRAGPGIAGASFEQRRVWNGNWSAQWNGERQRLTATAEEFNFALEAEAAKPLVIHGANGVSQKAEGAGKASHYVSFPRLKVTGGLQVEGARYRVSGMAWMDHEWFTHQLDRIASGLGLVQRAARRQSRADAVSASHEDGDDRSEFVGHLCGQAGNGASFVVARILARAGAVLGE